MLPSLVLESARKTQLKFAQFNKFCKALPGTTYVMQWGGCHVWKVADKVFAIGCWEGDEEAYTIKVSPWAFEVLQEQPGLRPAPYLASRGFSWIQHFEKPGFNDKQLKDYILKSYEIVLDGVSKKKRRELGLLMLLVSLSISVCAQTNPVFADTNHSHTLTKQAKTASSSNHSFTFPGDDLAIGDKGELIEQANDISADHIRSDNEEFFSAVPTTILEKWQKARTYPGIPYDPAVIVKAMNEIIAKYPKFKPAYFTRAMVAHEHNNPDAALKDFVICKKLSPNDRWPYVMCWDTYMKRGNFKQVVKESTFCLKLRPYDVGLRQWRERAYRSLGETKLADQDAADAKKWSAYSMGTPRIFNRSKVSRSELLGAVRQIQSNPADGIAYVNRGDMYLSLGKYKLAMDDFNKAQKLPITDIVRAFVLHDCARCMAMTKDYDAALQFAREAIKIYEKGGPWDWESARVELAYLLEAEVLMEQQKYEESVRASSEYIKRFPFRCNGYLKRAYALVNLKRLKEALADCERSAALNPENERAILTAAHLTEVLGDSSKAISHYSHLLSRHSELVDVYLARGRLYEKLGKNNAALKDYTKMIELASDDPVAYEARARLYVKMGNKAGARADFDLAIKASPEDAPKLKMEKEMIK